MVGSKLQSRTSVHQKISPHSPNLCVPKTSRAVYSSRPISMSIAATSRASLILASPRYMSITWDVTKANSSVPMEELLFPSYMKPGKQHWLNRRREGVKIYHTLKDQLHRPTEAMRERATAGLQFPFRYVILLA